MTTTHAKPLPRPTGSVLPGVLRSEFTKLTAVRSTFWLLLTTAAVTVAVSAIVTAAYASRYTPAQARTETVDPTFWSLDGLFFAQLAIGVLGVLTMSGEYSSGLISATFAAVPRRRTVFLAKAAVVSGAALCVGLVSSFAAFFLGQAVLSGKHIDASIGQPGVLRAVIGGGLYLAVLTLLAHSLGALIRHTAGAIAALVGLLLVLPAIGAALPSSWQNTVSAYFPGNAGPAVLHVAPMAHTAAPWTGFATFCAYTAAAFIAALVVLPRRDTLPR